MEKEDTDNKWTRKYKEHLDIRRRAMVCEAVAFWEIEVRAAMRAIKIASDAKRCHHAVTQVTAWAALLLENENNGNVEELKGRE